MKILITVADEASNFDAQAQASTPAKLTQAFQDRDYTAFYEAVHAASDEPETIANALSQVIKDSYLLHEICKEEKFLLVIMQALEGAPAHFQKVSELTDAEGNTTLHLMAEHQTEVIWQHVLAHASDARWAIRAVSARNNCGRTLLHLAAGRESPAIFRSILKSVVALSKDPSWILPLLHQRDSSGDFALGIAAMSHEHLLSCIPLEKEAHELLKGVFTYIRENFSWSRIKEELLAKHSELALRIQVILSFADLDLAKILLEHSEFSEIHRKELANVLLTINARGQNSLFFAAQAEHSHAIISYLLTHVFAGLRSSLSSGLKSQDHEGTTALHWMCARHMRRASEELELLAELLQIHDRFAELKAIVRFHSTQLDVLAKLLQIQDSNGNTPLHILSQHEPYFFSDVLDDLKRAFASRDDLWKATLNVRNQEGHSAHFCLYVQPQAALLASEPDALTKMALEAQPDKHLGEAKNEKNNRKVIKIFQRFATGHITLHEAAGSDLTTLQTVCHAHSRQNLLLAAKCVDSDGCTPLHWAAACIFPENLKYLLAQIDDFEEVKRILSHRDETGQTPFHFAANNMVAGPLVSVLREACSREPSFYAEQMKQSDNEGLTPEDLLHQVRD